MISPNSVSSEPVFEAAGTSLVLLSSASQDMAGRFLTK